MANDKKDSKPSKPKKDKNTARKGSGDVRKDADAKLKRTADRIEALNRRYFGGTNDLLQNAHKSITAVQAYVAAQSADWKPVAQGKKALIIGAKIMLRPDLSDKEMKQYEWMDDTAVLNGATIIGETDARNFAVKRTDGVKTRVLKKHLTAWFPLKDEKAAA
jgi:hypothetical protein